MAINTFLLIPSLTFSAVRLTYVMRTINLSRMDEHTFADRPLDVNYDASRETERRLGKSYTIWKSRIWWYKRICNFSKSTRWAHIQLVGAVCIKEAWQNYIGGYEAKFLILEKKTHKFGVHIPKSVYEAYSLYKKMERTCGIGPSLRILWTSGWYLNSLRTVKTYLLGIHLFVVTWYLMWRWRIFPVKPVLLLVATW